MPAGVVLRCGEPLGVLGILNPVSAAAVSLEPFHYSNLEASMSVLTGLQSQLFVSSGPAVWATERALQKLPSAPVVSRPKKL